MTNLVNQEIGVVQRDLGAWARSTDSSVIFEASAAFGWVDLPSDWTRVVLDARAWGGVPGAVAVCSRAPAPRQVTQNVPAAAVAVVGHIVGGAARHQDHGDREDAHRVMLARGPAPVKPSC